MGAVGFEPTKAEPSDLQSDPFVHFGTRPSATPQVPTAVSFFSSLLAKWSCAGVYGSSRPSMGGFTQPTMRIVTDTSGSRTRFMGSLVIWEESSPAIAESAESQAATEPSEPPAPRA